MRLKTGIPLIGKYSGAAATLKNTGYYSEEIYEYTTPQFMGFGTFNDITSENDLEFKTAFFLSLETGMNFILRDKFFLYVGAYLDYALNNMVNKTSLPFVEYNTLRPTSFTLNSIANSQHTKNNHFVDKISPVAFGIKVGFMLGIGDKR